MNSPAVRFYEFGPFRLDPAERLLWRQGKPLHLPSKAFDTLLLLVQHGGRLVTKEVLLEQVWPDTFVEEGNIKVVIFTLRKLLEENGGPYIETIPKRGYRFVPEVRQRSGEATGASGEAPPRPAASKSIAILPLRLLGMEDADQGFGLGVADALITRLSHLRQVIVRPTSAVLKYAGREQDPVAAGRELRVASVLEGSIQKAGGRVRVTVQLVSGEDGSVLWADRFDEEFTDIFSVEDSISEQVARALTDRLSGEERRRLTKRYTENAEAYQLYLKGRYYWFKRTSAGLRKGIDYFRQAIDLDPTYALALSGLADCYAQLSWMRIIAPGEAFPKAKAAATRALELDEELAEAHTSIAWIKMLYDWEWGESESEFQRAIELNPNYAIAPLWYTVYLIATSRFEEAVAEIGRAQQIDPLSPLINTIAGWPFYFARQYDQAIARYQKALEIDPNCLAAHILLGYAYEQMGEPSSALEVFQKARQLDETAWMLAELGHVYALSGATDKAQEVLAELSEVSKSRYVSPYDIAEIYACLGEKDEAFAWLERAFTDRPCWLIFLGVEPRFDSLRTDARFAGLLRRLGLKPPSGSFVA